MKNKKFLITSLFVGVLAMSFGLVMNTANKANTPVVTDAATTIKTISAIYGKNRPGTGEGGRSLIAVSGKEIVGTYGSSYVGNVYTATGEELSLTLIPNGGTGSAAWAGQGTRRFDLRVDYTAFYNSLGGGTTFYITDKTVFVGSDCNIVFGKQYKFTSIYDGNCAYNEFAPTTVSFDFKEIETRTDAKTYRMGASDFSGISAGFADTFQATINGTDFEIKDWGAGNTAAGNRRIKVSTSKEVSGHTFYIPDGTVFTKAGDIEKALVLANGYYVNADNAVAANKFIKMKTAKDYATFGLATLSCDATGAAEPTYENSRSWTMMNAVFMALGEEAKTELKNGASSQDADVKNFIEKYSYIVGKYGTTKYPNFIGVEGITAGANNIMNMDNSSIILYVVAAITAVMVGISFYAIARKKKHQ